MKSLTDFQASAIKTEAMTKVQGGKTSYDIVIVWAVEESDNNLVVVIDNLDG